MREKPIEQEAVNRVKARQGYAIKLGWSKGIPDRLFIWPFRNILFAEFKASNGGVLDEAQLRWHKRLARVGFIVAVINDYETLDLFLPKE